ncbi:MAG: uracil-DNA glycosylase [Planctomycetota bacterium]
MFSKRYPVLQGLSTQDKIDKLATLQAAFEQDANVKQTRPTGTRLVWSDGSPDADIMFIGEGPGEVEDREGLPFVGPAGELLNKMITAMGLDRQSVYIANVVKYRPPGNRVPTPEEAAISGPYLAQQAAIVAPKAIVALGGTAAKFALQTSTGITRLRGQWSTFGFTDPGIDLMPTFHPAYLLRSYTTDNRKKVWEDLQAVLKKVQ